MSREVAPISLLDRILDQRSHFHAEMDPMEVEVEGREVQNRSPTTQGFGDHEDPAVAWGRKVGHLFLLRREEISCSKAAAIVGEAGVRNPGVDKRSQNPDFNTCVIQPLSVIFDQAGR